MRRDLLHEIVCARRLLMVEGMAIFERKILMRRLVVGWVERLVAEQGLKNVELGWIGEYARPLTLERFHSTVLSQFSTSSIELVRAMLRLSF